MIFIEGKIQKYHKQQKVKRFDRINHKFYLEQPHILTVEGLILKFAVWTALNVTTK